MEREQYEKLAKEEQNWYFASRRLFFSRILEKFLSRRKDMKLLDMGCGSGQMFNTLGKYGKVIGMEPSLYALGFSPNN